MIKIENQIIENPNGNIKTSIKLTKKHSKKIKEQKSIRLYRLILNIIFSLIMIVATIHSLVVYRPQWRMFFFFIIMGICNECILYNKCNNNRVFS